MIVGKRAKRMPDPTVETTNSFQVTHVFQGQLYKMKVISFKIS